MLKSDSEII